MNGFATSSALCHRPNRYTLYFAAQFSRPFAAFGTWTGPRVSPGSRASMGGQSGAYVSFNTASALIQLGRAAEAPPHLAHALETMVRLDYRELVAWCFVAAAALAAFSDPEVAATLLGAADGTVEAAGVTFGPAEQKLRAWVLSKLAGRCDPREVEDSMLSGRALPLDDAVLLAQRYLEDQTWLQDAIFGSRV